jgi:hypothetical protein
MENFVKPGIYKHFKGGFVLVLFCAKHSDREEIEVTYKGLNNGKYYARPIESFCEIIDIDDQKVSRFSPATLDEAGDLLTDEIKSLIKAFSIK